MHRIDQLIARSSSWDAFWTALTHAFSFPLGEAVERITQLYLQSHPEYRSELKRVWRVPEEVPPSLRRRLRLPSTDEGIDLLAETRDGKYWAIQCKFRSDTKKPLTYGELSTFTSLAFVTCKGISLAIVAHTCSKPVRKHQYLGNTAEIGLDRWLGLTREDWRAIQAQIAGKTLPLVRRPPRPHQKVAIEAARKHFATEARGRMIMPCGTGKSLTAFWIAQALDAKTIIVAVPSLALIRQSLLDWTREYLAHEERPHWLVVCSDETTGKLERDEFVGQTYDLGIPTTTSAKEIVPFLRHRGGRRLIFTTYQSSAALAQASRTAGITIDLAILDEAHKTVGVKSKTFAALLSDENIRVRRRLFMTATERVLCGKNDDVFSMDDETVYGKRFHQLTFKDAIAQKIISDYRILTITVSDQSIRDLIVENRLIDVKGDETEVQALAAAVALQRAFQMHGVKHAISFHRSIKAASDFRDRQAAIDEATRSRIASLHVSSKKTAGERAELMRDFIGEKRALMTNARCLTEGVDVPAIDCVLFADPKQSVVDIVQAAGRALRPFPGKQYGYILLPLVVPAGIEVGTFAETTEFKQVTRTITALSTQDERIAEQFRVVEYGRKRTAKVVEIEGDVPVGLKLDIAAFAEQIGIKLWERVARANWRSFEFAREFARNQHLRNETQWREYSQTRTLPFDIPASPRKVYANKGWKNWPDWLGSNETPRGGCRSFHAAREFVRALSLKSDGEWRNYLKKNALPSDIPAHPERVYRNSGWMNLGDWLGTGYVATYSRKYRQFDAAREYVRALGLANQKAWKDYYKSGRKPADIPTNPNNVYRDEGWKGLGDWLGTGTTAPRLREYLDFEEARKCVRALGIKSWTLWRKYATSGKKPKGIPSDPKMVYRGKGWVGLGDWLGTGTLAPRNRKFRSFANARAFSRSLMLHSRSEWHAFCASGDRPADVPSNPDKSYRGKGWAGMRDWLGTQPALKHKHAKSQTIAPETLRRTSLDPE